MRSTTFALSLAAALGGAALGAGCGTAPKTPEERGKAAVVQYREGVALFNEGKIDAGISALQKGADVQPAYTLLRMDLGRMLLVRATGSDQAALRLFEEGKRLREDGGVDKAKVKEDEAERLHRAALDDFRVAHGHFLWVSEIWPHEANVFYWLSLTSSGLGDYESAERHLERALEIAKPVGPVRERMNRQLDFIRKARLQSERLREGS